MTKIKFPMKQMKTRFLKNILLILTALPICNVSSVEYKIDNETDIGFYLNVWDKSELKWELSENYPNSESYFLLGDAHIQKITDQLNIPSWKWKVALPTPIMPMVLLTNTEFVRISLDKPLLPSDLKALSEKRLFSFHDIGYMRDVAIGTLEIFPVQPGDRPDEVMLLKSADVHIQYSETFTKKQHINLERIPEILYELAFVNGESAKKWRHPRQISLEKPPSFPDGKWLRFTVKEDDMYVVTFKDLQTAGIDEDSIDVHRIYLYSNSTGGRELPSQNGADVSQNLVQNSRKILGGDDGSFNNGDSILFYGRATSGIDASSDGKLKFKQNVYSFKNYYWLLIADSPGSPREMPIQPSVPDDLSTTLIVEDYEKIDHHEVEASNFYPYSKDWYGEKFSGSGSSVMLHFDILVKENGFIVNIRFRTKGATSKLKGSIDHNFKMYVNNFTTPVKSWSSSNYGISTQEITLSDNIIRNGPNYFRISYTSSVSSAEAYLDYFECKYLRELKSGNEHLDFWAPNNSGLMEYHISDVKMENPVVYDITNWQNVSRQSVKTSSENNLVFRSDNNTSSRKHFLLTSPAHYLSPTEIKSFGLLSWSKLGNQERGADYIIITTEDFITAAEDIARLHSEDVKEEDRLSTLVVLQDEVFREFNAGIPDPIAIRFFLKYARENWTSDPQYALLFGDATYDYRGIESNEGNHILTYYVGDYCTDARFGYINGSDHNMDIAIGRITVRTPEEAQYVADKIRKYTIEPEYGKWRNCITLVADDPERPNTNENIHINDSEKYIAKSIPKLLTVDKLYLLEYPEVQDASTYGVQKPAATKAILSQLERGTTIINYLGHGSSTVWAQEKVLKMNRDLGLINTGMKLPFWVAATCGWGAFDGITGTCMAEALVYEPENGGIATLAATRGTYAGANSAFISSLYQKLFANGQINRIRLGTLFRSILNGENSNNEKYILFGDPALYLALPYEIADFDKLQSDSLKALSRVSLSGQTSSEIHDFSGKGFLTVFDSDYKVTREYLDRNKKPQSLSYILPGEYLFQGYVQIDDGKFSSRFFVPKDLNHGGRLGMINLYAWDEDSGVELAAFYDSLTFEGSESISDTTGPEILIGFQNRDFNNGDAVTSDLPVVVKIYDSHGINTTGQLGHNIMLQFDSDEDKTIEATDKFSYDVNSDTSGTITIPLPDLEPGEHTISVTVWDNANNSNTAFSAFSLITSTELELAKVVNYPNPFRKETDITFFLTQPAEVKISIYTIRGLLIRNLESEGILQPDFHFISWDGKDDFGSEVARGIYLYQIKAVSYDGDQNDTYIGKMVKAK